MATKTKDSHPHNTKQMSQSSGIDKLKPASKNPPKNAAASSALAKAARVRANNADQNGKRRNKRYSQKCWQFFPGEDHITKVVRKNSHAKIRPPVTPVTLPYTR